MQVSRDVFAHPPPAVRPPPVYADNASIDMSFSGMKNSSSSNSLDRYTGAPPAVALAGPSFPTSVVVSSKGSKYEISGPTNFQHVAGDVTRDRTRNAFDLSAETNDNVLRKYMIERGITEADISEMRRQDVIQKIVHSNYTWMPKKGDLQNKPKGQEPTRPLLYATISTNNQITPPPSPPPVAFTTPAPATSFANYAALTSRFVDISDMDMPVPAPSRQQEVGSVIPVQVQPSNKPKVPPPPSTVMANNSHGGYPAAIDIRHVRPAASPVKPSTETYATISPQRKAGTMRIPPPAPPKPTIGPSTNATASSSVQYALIGRQQPPSNTYSTASMASVSSVQYGSAKPPPPAPPAKPRSPAHCQPPAAASYVPPPPPMQVQSTKTHVPVPPPPPPASAGGIPPPPPPMPVSTSATTGGGPPPPPPPPSAGGPPAPPPMQKSVPKVAPAAADDRGALLESIRKGVALKKVDQKAATISGIKPRAERKPPANDFLSELKLGITLRRVKNPADNPFSEESQA
ncbi:uncharacterized protein Dana_GF23189, isoform F [Drosophila ananassae]|nr:formin-like protein 20 isoform X2 [Drosophila ananassae]KPU72755.1 uncharacterized protein Dana_GF23189, isoform D [Drosophila ananassae]KPU72757.1 uncharacterized protein Dana_GF23189, isoform F [Drosophila ananassae]